MHRHKVLKAISVMAAMRDVDDPEMETALVNAGFTKREAGLE
jgi:metal-sulfur cluster biosynthetic enzyme